MATSGSIDYSRNRDEIIKGALRLVGKHSRGRTLSAEDTADANEALNVMIKAWQAQGIRLWKLKESTLFITKGTASYSLSGAHCTHTYVETDVKVAGAASASTIDVDTITGMASADNIGIELDDGTFHWTTINGAPSGDTVTLTDVLPSAAAVDNTVYTYTTKINRPLKIIDARRKDTNDIPIEVVSRKEYFDQPNKTSTGKVNLIYYDPQLTTGTLYIWPTGSEVDDKIQFTTLLSIEDFDSASDDADFPQEWLLALKWSLASELGPEYGLDLDRQRYVDSRARFYRTEAAEFDTELASTQFVVDNNG